jgi:hypothetical protein
VTDQLQLIADQCPHWATVTQGEALSASVQALPSGKPYGPVALLIKAKAGKVTVEEAASAARWPTACPERHINHDGTFCVGEGAINSPQTSGDAELWWEALGKFIVGQRYADAYRTWPYPRSLHHGDASKHQRKLESLARGTILANDVEDALHGQSGWISGPLPRLHRTENRLTNLRSPCPRGCTRRGRPIVRRRCKQRQLIFEIVREERHRRSAELEFWKSFPRKECCGTMENCPLANVEGLKRGS